MTQFKITRLFTSGILKGLTHTCITNVNFKLNKTYKSSGSNYKIISKEAI